MTSARERTGFAVGAALAVVVFALFSWAPTGADQPGAAARGGSVAQAPGTEPEAVGEHDEDPNEEAAEQAEGTERRLEALEAATERGTAGQAGKREYLKRSAAGAGSTAATAAVGWAGEVPADPTFDDWEPAIAADPTSAYVYILTTRYGPKPCSGNCPSPYIALLVSSNGGASFGAPKALCPCKGSGQFDPIIEVVPSNGAVYALYMNGFNIMFTKSAAGNHGATWSTPVKVYGNVSWNDKPVIAVSDDGRDVYAAFNGPTGGDPWVAQSHDFGATWSQTKVVDSNRYIFAFDADVAPDGTVYLAQTSLLYGGGGNKGTYPTGAIEEHVYISIDRGAHWQDKLVAQVQPGVACTAEACPPDYYLAHSAISADANGALVLAYDGATAARGLQTISVQRSTDRGQTWSAAATVSTATEEALDPMLESRGAGDVRIAWAETSGGGNVDAWNTWYRRSTDGGATWTPAVRISDAISGAAYKSAAGYAEVYGDYGELAITNAGKTIAVWGEGASYAGPGGVWINREQ
jgi:hypothetical protein